MYTGVWISTPPPGSASAWQARFSPVTTPGMKSRSSGVICQPYKRCMRSTSTSGSSPSAPMDRRVAKNTLRHPLVQRPDHRLW